MLAAGISAGERVVYLGKNSDEFFLALYGTAKRGACFCPLNWRLSEPELCRVLADTDARLAFVEPEFATLWAAMLKATGLSIHTQEVDRSRGAEDPLRHWLREFPDTALPPVPMEAGAIFAPAMIQMLLDHPSAAGADFSSLRLMMYADAMAASAISGVARWGPRPPTPVRIRAAPPI